MLLELRERGTAIGQLGAVRPEEADAERAQQAAAAVGRG